MSYQQMAYIYDQFMTDAPYDKWLNFTEEIFEKKNIQGKNIADLGCGTGEITIRLAKQGYNVKGVDNSSEMLAIAEQKASDNQLSISWLQQDLQNLQGISQLDGVISFCDVINYITIREEVKQVFHNVASSLREGGLFLFDVHSIHHVENNMVNQTFADVTEESSYIWFCEEGDELGEMYHDLTFFVKNGQRYDKFSEFHQQKALSVEEYKQYLIEAGFGNVDIYNDFAVDSKLDNEATRIFFVAEKKTENYNKGD